MAASLPSKTKSSINREPEIIDVELEYEKRQYIEQLFHKNNIFIPERFHQRLLKSNITDKFISIILEVNKEEEEEKKRKTTSFGNKKQQDKTNPTKRQKISKEISTQTQSSDFEPIEITEDSLDYNEDYAPGYTYITRSFYDHVLESRALTVYKNH